MFVVGETSSRVFNGKVALPKAYHLKRRGVIGKWKEDNILYLSDSEHALNFIAGEDGEIFVANIDSDDRLQVPMEHEREIVNISGCISTIELLFKEK